MQVLLSTTYFGPVQWYQKLHRADAVHIEKWESFIKQTYRNRCQIATTNGVQALTVPVERGTSPLIKDLPCLLSVEPHLSSRISASAIMATGAICTGWLCRALTANRLSLSIIRMTYVLSSRNAGIICWILMRPSARKCANSSIFNPR